MLRTRQKALAALALMVFTVGCASAPRKPAGQLAAYGLKLAQGIGGAQEVIGTVGKASTKPNVREAAAAALEKIDVANQKGIELAPILRAIDSATSPNEAATGIAQAQQLLNQIVAAAGAAGGALGNHPELAEGLKAANQLIALVGTIQLELGKVRAQ